MTDVFQTPTFVLRRVSQNWWMLTDPTFDRPLTFFGRSMAAVLRRYYLHHADRQQQQDTKDTKEKAVPNP